MAYDGRIQTDTPRRRLSAIPFADNPRSSTSDITQNPIISAPLVQTQWTDTPEAYRPRDWLSNTRSDKPLPRLPDNNEQPTSSAGPREPGFLYRSGHRLTRSNSPEGRRHRPTTLQNTSTAQRRPGFDPNFLFPQRSPYDPLLTSRSAPDDFVQASQPDRPEPWRSRHSSDFSPFSPATRQLPRSPAYPSAGSSSSRRRRTRRAGGLDSNEAAFQDEEEFRLFIDATTGIGPFPAFRPSSSRDPVNTSEGQQDVRQPVQHVPGSQASVVSPLGDTPTTLHILRDLARMPHQHPPPSPDNIPLARNSFNSRVRPDRPDSDDEDVAIDISESGLGVFTHRSSTETDVSWLDTEQSMPDDELPSYATSQAEASAARRQAAARRAEELQRKWREGGRRYGTEY